jgi:hypothetical protein
MGFYYHNSVCIRTFRLIGGEDVRNVDASRAESQ